MFASRPWRLLASSLCLAQLSAGLFCSAPRELAAEEPLSSPPIMHHVQATTERMEMTVNTSRLLTLDLKVPRAQVNNKDILDLTALSPNSIQVFAKKPGVTQVNLWDEKNQIHTLDVAVFGDARELQMVLKSQFPHATVNVTPSATSVILSGYVPEADQAVQIVKIAEDYYPKVINSLKVGGAQQVLLHVKVLEVSRTKLRNLGFDFWSNNHSFFAASSPSGLLNLNGAAGTQSGAFPAPSTSGAGGDTIRFGIVSGPSAFFGFLEALRTYNLAKVMAEPTLVAVSGSPAHFNDGGEFPILIPAGLGTVSVDFKSFGSQVDFVPLVMGNGVISLDVRPRISFLDSTLSVTTQGVTIPGLSVREAITHVELKAGQTLAIAGLVQNRTEYQNNGIPGLADLPYFGAAFRNVHEQINEVELLILVTPELVEPLDPCDVPPCLPGSASASPNDHQLYWEGRGEVPAPGPCGVGGCHTGCGGSCGCNQSGMVGPSGAAVPSPAYTGPRAPAEMGSTPLDPNVPVLYGQQSGGGGRSWANRPCPSSPLTEPSLIGPTGYENVK